MRRIQFTSAVILVAGLLATGIQADSWLLPKKTKYYSINKRYYVEITPKKLDSQLKYFEDKVNKKNNAGTVEGLKDNHAKAEFYVRNSHGSYLRKAKFVLVNEVAPVSAVVSNDGLYVITFDNWHSVGYGDDVVVIYRSDGKVVRKLGLKDILTGGDIETLPTSVSSIWWGGDHYIDDTEGVLVLKIVSNRKSPWEETATFHNLKIELATGTPKEAKHDLFPQPRVFASVAIGPASEALSSTPGKPVCASTDQVFDSADALRISSEELFAKGKALPLPPYPAIAKAAHAEGSVNVELLISPGGDVICARALSGHPLLQGAALRATLNWKFEPLAGTDMKRIGVLAVNFRISQTDGGPR